MFGSGVGDSVAVGSGVSVAVGPGVGVSVAVGSGIGVLIVIGPGVGVSVAVGSVISVAVATVGLPDTTGISVVVISPSVFGVGVGVSDRFGIDSLSAPTTSSLYVLSDGAFGVVTAGVTICPSILSDTSYFYAEPSATGTLTIAGAIWYFIDELSQLSTTTR